MCRSKVVKHAAAADLTVQLRRCIRPGNLIIRKTKQSGVDFRIQRVFPGGEVADVVPAEVHAHFEAVTSSGHRQVVDQLPLLDMAALRELETGGESVGIAGAGAERSQGAVDQEFKVAREKAAAPRPGFKLPKTAW